jgi:hypothetical protein
MDGLAMPGTVSELQLANIHLRQQQYEKQQRWLFGSLLSANPCDPGVRLDPRRTFAREVERAARERIEAMGLQVVQTRHTENYDLLTQGVRVEVKAAHWDGRRYQAQLRANQADVLVMCCVDGMTHWLVAPFDEVARGKRVVEIHDHDPIMSAYWFRFYEAWETIAEMVRAGRNAWQPAML